MEEEKNNIKGFIELQEQYMKDSDYYRIGFNRGVRFGATIMALIVAIFEAVGIIIFISLN